MSSYHFDLALMNPAFKEEEGVTTKNGLTISFFRSDGVGRMLHVDACKPTPRHNGLHSVTSAKPRCKQCLVVWELFMKYNDAFQTWLSLDDSLEGSSYWDKRDVKIQGHHGDLFRTAEFVEACLSMGFTAYDGHGDWTDGKKILGHVSPRDVVRYVKVKSDSRFRDSYTKAVLKKTFEPKAALVLWYNK